MLYNINYSMTSSHYNPRPIDSNNRFMSKVPQTYANKPRPRQSQPPMMTHQFDYADQSQKRSKQLGMAKNNPFGSYQKMNQNKLAQSPRINRPSLQSPDITEHQGISQYQNQSLNNLGSRFLPKTQTSQYSSKLNNPSKISLAKVNTNYNSNLQQYDRKASIKIDNLQYKSMTNLDTSSSLNKNIVSKKAQGSSNFPYQRMLSKNQPKKQYQVNTSKKAPRMSQPAFFNLNSQQENDSVEEKKKQKVQQVNILQPPKSLQQSEPKQIKNMKFLTPSPAPSTVYVNNNNQKKLFDQQAFMKKQKQLKETVSTQSTLASLKSIVEQPKGKLRMEDFEKGKQLGSGKFGVVNVVRHKQTGFICAMKKIPKAIIKQENIINQFIRQIKIQSVLDHPNITKLYGFFDDLEYIYLLLELGSEGQLYKLLKQKQRLNEKTAVYIVKQLCEGLLYLHSQHVIHRDIKPENIVIQYGIVKLCDFGWAVNRGRQLRSTFCGTPLYVSPQILKGQSYDEKIDLWAIGILTYQLLIGQIPFEITTEQQLVKIIKDDIIFPTNIKVSAEAKDFVLKILKKNPQDRLKVGKLLEHPFIQQQVDLSELQF